MISSRLNSAACVGSLGLRVSKRSPKTLSKRAVDPRRPRLRKIALVSDDNPRGYADETAHTLNEVEGRLRLIWTQGTKPHPTFVRDLVTIDVYPVLDVQGKTSALVLEAIAEPDLSRS